MISLNKKVALLLVLSFLTVHNAEHHTHDHNHQDALSAFDHHFHEYHHNHTIEKPNCGQICPKTFPKFQQFEVGHVYTVELDGQTLINVKEGQTIGLKTKIDVHVLSPCEFSLTLRDTQVSGVPNPQELAQQLDSSPALRFGAFDGKILGVCPTPQEEIWTLNVKKAALSAMQITSKDLTANTAVEELDFSGHCTTNYRPLSDTSDTKNILLEKSKNLNKCHLRRKNIAGFSTKSLGLLTEFLREHLPIVKSTQRCVQEIKGGHLFSVSCTEEQRINFQEDSIVVSTLNLRFGGKAAKGLEAVAPVPETAQTLLMTRDDEGQKTATEGDVRALLTQMCAQVSGDKLSSGVTESFHSLVTSLRTLPEAGTRALDNALKSGELCPSPKLRHLFFGASAFAASDPSIQTLINAYNEKELTDTQISLALGLVALKTRPSDKTIESLVSLIQQENSRRSLMLGISLMVRNFCKRTENCLDVPAVKTTISALIDKLQKTDSNLVRISAIKALDNIKAKTDETVKTALLEWAEKADADTGVRVAAIQALKNLADDSVRQKLIDILLKHSEPTEVRVTAYKTVVKSGATAAQLESIKSGVDPQLKNYIQSHVRNLRKSSNPIRANLLPQDAPDFGDPSSLNLGVTRNVELSYKGATIESDVVYPKGSIIPSLYTVGVYLPKGDKDYQIFEIQIRQSGLSQHLNKILSKGLGGPEVLSQLTEELLEIMTFLKDPNHKHTVTLQLSVRIAGSNIIFIDTFEDLHRVVMYLKDRIKEFYYKDKIDLARGISLLDQQVEVPAILGFPIVFHLNETIVGGITAEHSWSESGNSKIRTVRSSRSLVDEISAGLNLKVRNYRPGFEYQLRFEAHPTSDAQYERIENRILKAKINLPNDRKSLAKLVQNIRLIDANGVAKESNEISGQPNDDNTRCRTMFGLNMCRSRTWVGNSPIPNVEYYVTKADPSVEALELTLERPASTATRDQMVWTAKANAGPREYLAQFELKNPKEGPKKASLKLVSPIRTITADTTLSKSADGNQSNIEFDLKLPNVIDINTKYDFEQKDEEKTIDILTEYKLAGSDRKETLKWNRKSSMSFKREKKSKTISISYFGDFKSSQFPNYNSRLSYYTNLKPYQNSKTDCKLEWGPELKDRLRLVHTSVMDIIELRPFQAVSENAFIIEATPLDINYDLKLKTDISMLKSKPKHISLDITGNDIEGRPNRAIRGNLAYDRTEAPIQQTINMSLAYPGREVSYYSEVQQTKDWNFVGKIIASPEKGKVVNIEHKLSSSKPTELFRADIEADVSYSHKPDKVKAKIAVGWATPEKWEYKHIYTRDGQKYSEWDLNYDKKTYGTSGKLIGRDRQTEFKVDNVYDPRSAQWGVKYGPKSYKFSALRVPKESLTLKLDSSENSRLKELKVKVSRKEKSSIRFVTDENLEVNAYIDPISKDKRAHLDFKCPKHELEHNGDIVVNRAERKLTWDSKTNLRGKPFITIEAQMTPKERSFFILKKIKEGDAVSKVEYFYEKGVYGAVVDTSQFSAILEGEYKNNKNFGKLGFVDKVNNYEHKSQFNVSNGILTLKSISDEEKQTFTKLDAVIGRRIISNITLITPKINAQLTANPLGEKKTLVLKFVSPKYDHDSNLEWVPHKYLKLDAVSQKKTEPQKKVKVDAYLTRQDESTFRVVAPQLDVDIRRVKTPKPRYIFNTTINGYNEVQEFDSNPSLTPLQNLLVALNKYFQSYTSDN